MAVTCEVLGLSRQAFSKWQNQPASDRDWDNAVLVNAIVDAYCDEPEFGFRFLADELERAGHRASENRVHRLCHEHRIWSTTTRKGRRGSKKRPGPAVHDDLVERDSTADRLDKVWLSDITEHPSAWISVVVATPDRKWRCLNRSTPVEQVEFFDLLDKGGSVRAAARDGHREPAGRGRCDPQRPQDPR